MSFKKKIVTIQVKVTTDQKLMFQNKAQALGFKNMSDYIRQMCLKDDLQTQIQINKIYKLLIEL